MGKKSNSLEVCYFNIPPGIKQKKIKSFVVFCLKQLKFKNGLLNIVFLPNLKKLNKKFLKRNRDTNVIVFPWNEKLYRGGKVFLGEIYIGLEMAKKEKEGSLTDELIKLLSHGLLHLKGYSDKTEEENLKMKRLSDNVIKLWKKEI